MPADTFSGALGAGKVGRYSRKRLALDPARFRCRDLDILSASLSFVPVSLTGVVSAEGDSP